MSTVKTVSTTAVTSNLVEMSTIKQTTSSASSQQRLYGKIVLTLENCLLPESKFELTPSQADGLDRETEIDLRILGCELIQTAGILLKLPQVAMATGQVLFQRFFYSKSFVRHSMEATAMCCVCLASKIEEAPRRIRDVINVFHHIKQVRGQKPLVPMILDQHYINLKSQVIKAERRVLKELGFCVHVKHPHKIIVMYLKYLELEKHHMMQMAWNFMNDSFRTDVFVRYQPETIACACIYLTARKQNIPLPSNPAWYLIFRVSEEDMLDVCYRIMALYKRAKPNAEALEEAVDSLKKKYQEQKKKDRSETNTPPAVVTVDRNNGSHNAWGGFISRALPVTSNTDNNGNNNNEKDTKKSHSKSGSRSPRSRSRSRSRTPSRSRSHSPSRSSHSKTRSRSRTPVSRSRSRSRSSAAAHSPSHYNDKGGSRKSKKTRNRSRTPSKAGGKRKAKRYSHSRSATPESPPKYKKSEKKYDRRRDERDSRYMNGSDRDRPSKAGDRERERDRDRGRDHNRDRNRDKSGYDRDEYRKDHRSSHGNGDKRDKYSSSSSNRHSTSDRHRSSKHAERERDRRRYDEAKVHSQY
ncbi:cyclin-L1 [Sabethes cyaneus]|uniref:cyclin-L1 n=1 Tax=Sabethes cyaneus TaxID=53552 RepID=UPI00237EDF56|nr:cyclin-L1 [Sabethes cyaneus]